MERIEKQDESIESEINRAPIVDQHCHMYQNDLREIDSDLFTRILSLEAYNPDYLVASPILDKYLRGDESKRYFQSPDSMEPDIGKVVRRSMRNGRTTLLFRQSVRLLSSFLGCSSDFDSILKARNERTMRNGVNSYASELFRDARIETLILSDHPYLEYTPTEDEGGSWPVRLKHKLVVPALYFSMLDENQHASLSQFAASYLDEVERLLRKKDFVGIKSMIAYGAQRRGSGLQIGDPDEAVVRREFEFYREKKGRVTGHEIKNLNDYFHRLTLEAAIKIGVPFEFHTGIGDTDIVADKCNPMLLTGLLNDEKIRHARVILLHGGYPYSAEAAWMTHFFPNVYLDASIVFFTHIPAAARRIEEMLEMAPYGKMLYSSDGLMVPELYWVAAKMAKRATSIATSELMKEGVLEEKDALDFAHSFLHKNAEELYNL